MQAAGLDSLGAVELRNTLQDQLGIRLPATAVIDHPTIAALTDYVTQQLPDVLINTAEQAAADADVVQMSAAGSSASYREQRRVLGVLASAQRSPASSDGIGVVPKDTVGLVPLDRWDLEAAGGFNQQAR